MDQLIESRPLEGDIVGAIPVRLILDTYKKKGKGVPQSQTAALTRHQEETDKTKQAQIEQTHEKPDTGLSVVHMITADQYQKYHLN